MEYIVYAIIIGVGLGVSTASILTKNSVKVQNARDTLEAKKEWVRMVSTRIKIGERK